MSVMCDCGKDQYLIWQDGYLICTNCGAEQTDELEGK